MRNGDLQNPSPTHVFVLNALLCSVGTLFWRPSRCHLGQEVIERDAHVDIRDDMYAISLHVMHAIPKRNTGSC